MSDLQKSPASPLISIENPTKPIEINTRTQGSGSTKHRNKKIRQHLQSTINEISKDQSKHS